VAQLGRVHGTLLGDAALAGAEWLNRESPLNQALVAQLWAGFSDRYGETIAPAHRVVCERLVAAFDAQLAAEASADRVHGLIHGDYRLDNMLFGRPGADRPLTVVDWQTVTWGPAFTDLAYFLGCALPAETRRDHYDTLLRAYHQALGEQTPIDLDTVRDGVRRQSFFGVMMAIVSSMLVERTDRGDLTFMTMLQRHCDHVLDTDALAVLPEASMTEPLRPAAEDEGPHAPGGEELWNESWYFDFADDRQGVGGWVRLGLVPNQNTAWINALVCGPDMPTVAIVDFAAPLPDNPAALLRGEPGRPTELTMDLTWTTAGTPYQYRITPRYEIACTVSGSVISDGRQFRLDAVAGQRDHSWGVRDWWSMDWVWNALHLDDGTHIHGVDIRIPGAPPMSVGYLQPAGAPLAELTEVSAKAVFADNGLPVATTLTLQPGDVTVEVDVRGHAPVQLTAADGRVSQFPRAWAAITTGDGRTGIGWLEWNRNAR